MRAWYVCGGLLYVYQLLHVLVRVFPPSLVKEREEHYLDGSSQKNGVCHHLQLHTHTVTRAAEKERREK